MLRFLRKIFDFLFIAVAVEMFMTGCSERLSQPVMLADSTIVFPPKEADGISADIILCRKVYDKTGQRIDAGTVFTIREKENIYAFADLDQLFLKNERPLMFHIDWIDPEGKSFYQKRIDLSPEDSTSTLVSSISLSPGKRQAGEYMIRLYLFRELMAEKKFELLTESQGTGTEVERIKADITLCKSIDKETGMPKAVDSVFTIKEKGKVRAFISLENRKVPGDQQLVFQLDWIGPDGESFYKKPIDLLPGDTATIISSSISISPDKRLPGKYFLQVYLFDELLTEKRFYLLPESKIKPVKKHKK